MTVAAPEKTLTIVSRKSPLAMAQANIVSEKIKRAGFSARIVGAESEGDKTKQPLAEIGGKHLFVRELQNIVAQGGADFAVHSLKDMESAPSPRFLLAAVGFAEDSRDALLTATGARLARLPKGARVGTCSPRRAALLADVAPHLRVLPMRGNVGTRMEKMRNGECEAIVVAAAGLRRLGFCGDDAEYLPEDVFIPAPCQGLLGMECRAEDTALAKTLAAVLECGESRLRADAERAFSAAMGGDCRTALGARAFLEKGKNEIHLSVCFAAGGRLHRARAFGDTPQKAGHNAAEEMQKAMRKKQQKQQ